MIVERACAKVNLSLEIVGRRADGYHDLISLVAFACDVSDCVSFQPWQLGKSGQPFQPGRAGADLAVRVSGRTGGDVQGANTVFNVLEAVSIAEPDLVLGCFSIEKNIPVAAGLGGGSVDAAAAFRAIGLANGIDDPAERFGEIACLIGADVPVCLGGGGRTAAMMAGIGDRVWRPQVGGLLPQGLFAVLVNPGVGVPTGEVFNRLPVNALSEDGETEVPLVAPFDTVAALINYLSRTRNDLEVPAKLIAPEIGSVLEVIEAQRGCLLARMSGSGATCFGLFEAEDVARRASEDILDVEPDWWARVTGLR